MRLHCHRPTFWSLLGVLVAMPSPLRAECFPPGDLHQTTWEWVQSVGGLAGVRTTPETEGETRQLVVDVSGGTWDYFVDEATDRQENVSLDCRQIPVLGEFVVKVCDEQGGSCFDQALTLSQPPDAPWRLTAQDIGVFDGFWHEYELRDAFTPVTSARVTWTTVKVRFGG